MQRMNPILSDRIHNNNQENSILIEDCMYKILFFINFEKLSEQAEMFKECD